MITAASRTCRHRIDRTHVGLACIAVVLATSFGGRPTNPYTPAFDWLRSSIRNTDRSLECVRFYLGEGVLDGVDPATIDAARLRRHGISAFPLERRQLLGDILIACSLDPDDSDGR